MNRSVQIAAFEDAVDQIAGNTRPRGAKWEDHRDGYLEDFNPENLHEAHLAARNALNDWYVAREVIREQIIEREAILAAMDEAHR